MHGLLETIVLILAIIALLAFIMRH